MDSRKTTNALLLLIAVLLLAVALKLGDFRIDAHAQTIKPQEVVVVSCQKATSSSTTCSYKPVKVDDSGYLIVKVKQ
jgi:hypothetical protein